MSKATPTQRSLKHLRARGYTVAVVEKWNSHCRIRQDLWGFADLIAFNREEVVLVQTTTVKNMAARMTKIRENDVAKLWQQCSRTFPTRRIEVHGWKKAKGRWVVVVEFVQ